MIMSDFELEDDLDRSGIDIKSAARAGSVMAEQGGAGDSPAILRGGCARSRLDHDFQIQHQKRLLEQPAQSM